jgi:hypothetical protein
MRCIFERISWGSVTVQFGQNWTPIVYDGDHFLRQVTVMKFQNKIQVHTIIYYFLICASIVYESVNLWRSVTVWFGQNLTPIVYDGDHFWRQVTVMKFQNKIQVHSINYYSLICASIVYESVDLWLSITVWFGQNLTPMVYDGDHFWWQVTIMKFNTFIQNSSVTVLFHFSLLMAKREQMKSSLQLEPASFA